LRDESIKSNYFVIKIDYCSTTLSNHDIVRLVILVLKMSLSLIYI
jgi:hypothetical protein